MILWELGSSIFELLVVYLPLLQDDFGILFVVSHEWIYATLGCHIVFGVMGFCVAFWKIGVGLDTDSSGSSVFLDDFFVFQHFFINLNYIMGYLEIVIEKLCAFFHIGCRFVNLEMFDEFTNCISPFFLDWIFVNKHLKILFPISLCFFYLENSTFFLEDFEDGIGCTDVGLEPFIRIFIVMD